MTVVKIKWNPSAAELRVFAVLQLVFFGIVAVVLARRGVDARWLGAMLTLSTAVLVSGFVFPPLVRAVYVAWMAAVFPMGWVVSYAILAVVYYLVVTPIGIVLLLSGRRPLARKPDAAQTTYWIRRRGDESPQRYFRQF